MKRLSIAVAGGGLGGLAAAARLAAAGHAVELFEAAPTLGGKAGEIREAGYRFDTGPSLVTMPFVIRDLFAACGASMEKVLDLRPLSVLTRYWWSDGTRLDASADPAALDDAAHRILGERRGAVLAWLKQAAEVWDLSADLFLFHAFGDPRAIFTPRNLGRLFRMKALDPFRTLHQAHTAAFTDPRVVQLFDRFATYNGSDPRQTPATLKIIAHVEMALGGFVFGGGMRALADQIAALAIQKGAVLHTGVKVEAFLTEGLRVTGLRVHGQERFFDAVVSNLDAATTWRLTDHPKALPHAERLESFEPSTSALTFFWGVPAGLAPLSLHNILFSKDYDAEFDDLFHKKIYPLDPTIYIYVSRHNDPQDAPEGFENWFVMVNAPVWRGGASDPQEGVAAVRSAILRRLKDQFQVDLEGRIVFEKVQTPRDLAERTGSPGGSIYGISSNDRRAAFLRQPNRARPLRSLYFAGGSAHPGGGVPLVLLSADIAVRALRQDLER